MPEKQQALERRLEATQAALMEAHIELGELKANLTLAELELKETKAALQESRAETQQIKGKYSKLKKQYFKWFNFLKEEWVPRQKRASQTSEKVPHVDVSTVTNTSLSMSRIQHEDTNTGDIQPTQRIDYTLALNRVIQQNETDKENRANQASHASGPTNFVRMRTGHWVLRQDERERPVRSNLDNLWQPSPQRNAYRRELKDDPIREESPARANLDNLFARTISPSPWAGSPAASQDPSTTRQLFKEDTGANLEPNALIPQQVTPEKENASDEDSAWTPCVPVSPESSEYPSTTRQQYLAITDAKREPQTLMLPEKENRTSDNLNQDSVWTPWIIPASSRDTSSTRELFKGSTEVKRDPEPIMHQEAPPEKKNHASDDSTDDPAWTPWVNPASSRDPATARQQYGKITDSKLEPEPISHQEAVPRRKKWAIPAPPRHTSTTRQLFKGSSEATLETETHIQQQAPPGEKNRKSGDRIQDSTWTQWTIAASSRDPTTTRQELEGSSEAKWEPERPTQQDATPEKENSESDDPILDSTFTQWANPAPAEDSPTTRQQSEERSEGKQDLERPIQQEATPEKKNTESDDPTQDSAWSPWASRTPSEDPASTHLHPEERPEANWEPKPSTKQEAAPEEKDIESDDPTQDSAFTPWESPVSSRDPATTQQLCEGSTNDNLKLEESIKQEAAPEKMDEASGNPPQDSAHMQWTICPAPSEDPFTTRKEVEGSTEAKLELEDLVQRVVPEEIGNVGEMMLQFKGREDELVKALRTLQSRQKEKAPSPKDTKEEVSLPTTKQDGGPPVASSRPLSPVAAALNVAAANTSSQIKKNVSTDSSDSSMDSMLSTFFSPGGCKRQKSELELAIEAGNWKAVGEAAANLSVSTASSDDTSVWTEPPGKTNAKGIARAPSWLALAEADTDSDFSDVEWSVPADVSDGKKALKEDGNVKSARDQPGETVRSNNGGVGIGTIKSRSTMDRIDIQKALKEEQDAREKAEMWSVIAETSKPTGSAVAGASDATDWAIARSFSALTDKEKAAVAKQWGSKKAISIDRYQ